MRKVQTTLKFAGLSAILALVISCSHKPTQNENPGPIPNETETRAGIRASVESKVGEVEECYSKILNDSPQTQGKVVVQWTIGDGGKVVDASIKSTELHSQQLEDCLVGKVKTWVFPAPPNGQLQVISYPFMFRAVD